MQSAHLNRAEMQKALLGYMLAENNPGMLPDACHRMFVEETVKLVQRGKLTQEQGGGLIKLSKELREELKTGGKDQTEVFMTVQNKMDELMAAQESTGEPERASGGRGRRQRRGKRAGGGKPPGSGQRSHRQGK